MDPVVLTTVLTGLFTLVAAVIAAMAQVRAAKIEAGGGSGEPRKSKARIVLLSAIIGAGVGLVAFLLLYEFLPSKPPERLFLASVVDSPTAGERYPWLEPTVSGFDRDAMARQKDGLDSLTVLLETRPFASRTSKFTVRIQSREKPDVLVFGHCYRVTHVHGRAVAYQPIYRVSDAQAFDINVPACKDDDTILMVLRLEGPMGYRIPEPDGMRYESFLELKVNP